MIPSAAAEGSGRRSAAPGVLLALMVFAASIQPLAAAFTIEATVDASRIGMEDIVRYTVTLSDTELDDVTAPELPEMEAFEPAGGPSRHRYHEWINGRTRASLSWTWSLVPQREGDWVIPSTEVTYNGRTYQTNRVQVRVEEGRLRGDLWSDPFDTRRREAPDHIIRLQTDLSTEKAWAGEVVVLTYVLQSTLRLTEAQLTEAPEFPGFLVLDEETNDRGERIGTEDGMPLYEHELARYLLIPLEAGDKGIPAQTWRLKFRLPHSGFVLGRFDRLQEASRKAPARTVTVLPLPERGMPADYSGAVGRFALEASVSGNSGEVGDALSLRLSLSGSGNFPQVGPPELPDLSGFQVFAPQTETQVAVTRTGLNGRKLWEFVLVPRVPGDYEVPEIRFPYFDPGEGAYRTTKTRPVHLEVVGRPGESEPRDSQGGPLLTADQAPALLPVDVESLGGPARWERTWWFQALAALPLLFLLAGVVRRGQDDRLAARRERRRVRRARSVAQARLRRARGDLEDDARFFTQIQESVLGYLADKSGIPVPGRSQADRLLRESNVSEDLRDELDWVLARSEEGRYRPEPAERALKKEVLARAAKIVSHLDRKARWKGLQRVAAMAILLTLLPAAPAWAEPSAARTEDLAARAAAQHASGRYPEAEAIYRDLLREAPESAVLHYDLGLVLEARGEIGPAVLHLERARRLDPSLAPAGEALADLRERTGIAGYHRPLDAPRTWMRDWFPRTPALITALAAWWIFAAAAAVALARGQEGRGLWRGVAIAAFAVLLAAGLVFVEHLAATEWNRPAVILESAALRSGPAAEYPMLREVPEGTTGRLLRRREGWVQLDLPGGISGWVRSDRSERI